MEKNRKRALRRHHARRVFKARIKHAAVCCCYPKVHWEELYHEHWTQLYRTTGTLCSCWLCRGESYDRLQARKEANRIIREALDDTNQEKH